VGALTGVPIALEGGTVVSLVRGTDPAVVIRSYDRDRTYHYPASAKLRVRRGSVVRKLDPLCELPKIRDWTSGRMFTSLLRMGRADAFIGFEIEKYSALHIEIPAGSPGTRPGDPASILDQLDEYYRALALWVGNFRLFVTLLFSLQDSLEITDEITAHGLLHLRSALTLGEDPRYNDERGYVYDGSFVYDSALLEILPDHLTVDATNTSGAPITVHIFGADYAIPAGGTVTVTEPP